MNKNARGTKVIVSISPVKRVVMNIDKTHAEVTVFTFKKLGSKKKGESSIVLIKHGDESLPAEASVS